jgi:hypothetical protein
MTGIKSFNIPEFDRVADILRTSGYTVISPAELDDPAIRAISMASLDGAIATLESHGQTWWDFLERDCRLIATDGIETITVLPGWEGSKGARLETFVGHLSGKPIFRYSEHPLGFTLVQVVPLDLARAWSGEPWLVTSVPHYSYNGIMAMGVDE